MRQKVVWTLGVLVALAGRPGPAEASHCGASAYPLCCGSPDQCCLPAVQYQVCYQTVIEEQPCVCYRPVYRTVLKECRYLTYRPVYERHVRNCFYTVCKTCYEQHVR